MLFVPSITMWDIYIVGAGGILHLLIHKQELRLSGGEGAATRKLSAPSTCRKDPR